MAKLEHYGGDGFHSRENGFYQVRTNEGDTDFTSMSKAREFYDKLEGEKFFWDLTHGAELLDGWHFQEEGADDLPFG